MKLKINVFFKVVFIVLLLLVFVFGGFIQYFLGVPNTLYTLLILSALVFLIIVHTLIKRTIFLDSILICAFIYGLIIICSGIFNNTYILKILLYWIFPLIPFCVFYLFKILETRNIHVNNILSVFFKWVVLIQLPIILIQKFGYDFLVQFNNSNQGINEYDFMFGSFFIRCDHSLGFFLLIYLLSIIFNRKQKGISNTQWGLMTYITLTIFIMESNLTKLVLIIVFGYYIFIWLFKKINFVGMILMVFVGYLLFNLALLVPKINGQYEFFKNRYKPTESQIAFDKGYAKRPQIAIVYAINKKLKIIGEGPYNYYDIFTGKFKQTKHFSQLIWSYNDLGILGLLSVIFLAFLLITSLGLSSESRLLLLLVFMMYLFMTNVYSDLAMMFSLLLIRGKQKLSHTTVKHY